MGRAGARDEAPWPLEIHFKPAFISFPFSPGPHSHPSTKRVITEPRSLLPEPQENMKKGLQINTKMSLLDSEYVEASAAG